MRIDISELVGGDPPVPPLIPGWKIEYIFSNRFVVTDDPLVYNPYFAYYGFYCCLDESEGYQPDPENDPTFITYCDASEFQDSLILWLSNLFAPAIGPSPDFNPYNTLNNMLQATYGEADFGGSPGEQVIHQRANRYQCSCLKGRGIIV